MPSNSRSAPEVPTLERRQSAAAAAPAPDAWLGRIAPGWAHFHVDDIASARHHSEDFIETRAAYVLRRLRVMALFFAISVPLWIPVDYLTLSAEHFGSMVLARLALSLLLAAVVWATLGHRTPARTNALLAGTMLGTALFYVAAMRILQSGTPEQPLAGYTFMPFVMVAVLGLFPLTLLHGAALAALVLASALVVAAASGAGVTPDDLNRLWVFAMLAGATLWVQSGQLLMLLKLYRESTLDPLTGLINRRVLLKKLAREIEQSRRSGAPFSVLMFDLDRFKRINDRHGHLTGDQVLKTTAEVLRGGLRGHDVVARFGGEEFVAVLHGMDLAQAAAVAERMRAQCQATQVLAPNGEVIELSTSVGATQYQPGESVEAALGRVDECLYQAKTQGRNRVVCSPPLAAAADLQAVAS